MKSLAALRLVAALHAVAVCLQPVLAGAYLNGSGAAMRMHEPIGFSLGFVALVQLVIAVVYWRSGGRGSAVLVTLLVLSAEGVQNAIGHTRQFVLHLPLGVAIVAVTCVFAVWTFRPAARVRRTAPVVKSEVLA